MYTTEQLEDAEVLIEGISNALAGGVQHFNRAGETLSTVRDIVECLLDEGGVTIQMPVKH